MPFGQKSSFRAAAAGAEEARGRTCKVTAQKMIYGVEHGGHKRTILINNYFFPSDNNKQVFIAQSILQPVRVSTRTACEIGRSSTPTHK